MTYPAISLAAILEGEAVYLSAAVLVATGQLHALPVLVSGALGAAAGDQMYFYLLRGRVARWIERWRFIAARHAAVVARVRRHHVPMILAIRFAPGLRIAIAAACAQADVPPLRFSVLNLASAFAWAWLLLAAVVHGGTSVMGRFGLRGPWAAVLPAILILLFVWWLSRQAQQRSVESA